MTQMAQPYVDIWLRTRESVGEIIHAFSVMVLTTNLATTTMPGGSGGGGGDVLARLELFNMLRDNQGVFVIDKATEEFKNVSAPLGGLDHLQAQAQEHLCVTGDALIETERGQVPICEVTVNDRVMTRKGYAPIDWVGVTGHTNHVVEFTTAKSSIRVTACHPMYLPEIDEFVSAKNVSPSACLAESQSWANMERRSLGAGGGGEGQKLGIIETSKLEDCFTDRYGLLTKDRSRTELSFITMMKTQITTTFQICVLLTKAVTLKFISLKVGLDLISSPPLLKLNAFDVGCRSKPFSLIARCIAAKSANRQHIELVREILRSLLASIAETLFAPIIPQKSIVLSNASGVGTLASNFHSSNHASCAEQVSFQPGKVTNTAAQNAIASTTCVLIEKKREIVLDRAIPVYNLRVSDPYPHEYFANGLCVSNCSVARIPLVKFTGISPTGLNATNEFEMQAFYDTVHGSQEHLLRGHLTTIYDIMQIHLWGKRDPDITFDFKPLREATPLEKAAIRLQNTQSDVQLVDVGIISQEELRTKLVNDPDSGFEGLDPEQLPNLLQEEEAGLAPAGERLEGTAELENAEGGPQGQGAPAAAPQQQQQPQLTEQDLEGLSDEEIAQLLGGGDAAPKTKDSANDAAWDRVATAVRGKVKPKAKPKPKGNDVGPPTPYEAYRHAIVTGGGEAPTEEEFEERINRRRKG